MAKEKFMFELTGGDNNDVPLVPVSYAYNGSTTSAAEAAYLDQLTQLALTEDLSQDRRQQTLGVSIGFTALALIIVGLRFLARHRAPVRKGLDDYLVLAALLLLICGMAMNIIMVNEGLGLHSGLLTVDDLQTLYQTIAGADIIYFMAVNAVRVSVVFLYIRLFPTARGLRVAGLISAAASTALTAACIFVTVFQCTPRSKIWQVWTDGTCLDPLGTHLGIAVPGILLDVVIFCLPLRHALQLKMTRSRRVLQALVFLVGACAVLAGINRLVAVLAMTWDIPYTIALWCWMMTEISAGIVAACLPALGSLVGLNVTPSEMEIEEKSSDQ